MSTAAFLLLALLLSRRLMKVSWCRIRAASVRSQHKTLRTLMKSYSLWHLPAALIQAALSWPEGRGSHRQPGYPRLPSGFTFHTLRAARPPLCIYSFLPGAGKASKLANFLS